MCEEKWPNREKLFDTDLLNTNTSSNTSKDCSSIQC